MRNELIRVLIFDYRMPQGLHKFHQETQKLDFNQFGGISLEVMDRGGVEPFSIVLLLHRPVAVSTTPVATNQL
jgi:hypothetical protein